MTERLRPILVRVPGVRHLLAVLHAVARILERRVGLERTGIECGGSGDDLERRPRREESVRRAVEQRRAVAARSADAQHLRVIVLDEIGIVGRRRRHHVHGAGAHVHRHDGAAAIAELLLRDALRRRAERQQQAVALHRPAAELVQRTLERVAEVRVGARQIVVHRALQARLGARRGRVADRLGGHRVLRIAAEIERLPADLSLRVRSEDRLLALVLDQPALDRELHHALDRVVLLVLKARRRPRLPVRRRDDERCEEHDGDDREPVELPIQVAPPSTRSHGSRRASSRPR